MDEHVDTPVPKISEHEVRRAKGLATIEEAISEYRNGRFVIIIDDEDRENEGDLTIPAQFATPEAINFMARYGRGLSDVSAASRCSASTGLTRWASKPTASLRARSAG